MPADRTKFQLKVPIAVSRPSARPSRLAISYGFPYDIGMTEVVTTGEARDALHRIAKHFDAGEGEPVYFGSHRRAQGVIVPVEVWEMLLEQVEAELDVALARARLTNDKGRRLTPDEIAAVFHRLCAARGA
jgi:hypothetical protein